MFFSKFQIMQDVFKKSIKKFNKSIMISNSKFWIIYVLLKFWNSEVWEWINYIWKLSLFLFDISKIKVKWRHKCIYLNLKVESWSIFNSLNIILDVRTIAKVSSYSFRI